MNTHPQTAAEAVQNGVRLFDDIGPENWRKLIHGGTLDVWSMSDCPLGQLYETFSEGVKTLRELKPELSKDFPSYYGFDTSLDEAIDITFGDLTAAWRKVLATE